mgnify:CR=1 FL=1
MAVQIQIRRDSAANWTSVDPVLADGELGYELDTDYLKIGDGVTAWSSLVYSNIGPQGIQGIQGIQGVGINGVDGANALRWACNSAASVAAPPADTFNISSNIPSSVTIINVSKTVTELFTMTCKTLGQDNYAIAHVGNGIRRRTDVEK